MPKKYIIITGGELFNKGAQSMTFATIDELKRRYPSREIVLLSNADFARSEEEKVQYSFKIMPLPNTNNLLGGVYKLISKVKNSTGKKQRVDEILEEQLKDILNNTEIMIDISGYTLSSQRGAG